MDEKYFHQYDVGISVVPGTKFLLLLVVGNVTNLSFFKTRRVAGLAGVVDFVCIVVQGYMLSIIIWKTYSH